MMKQVTFAERAKTILSKDNSVTALLAGGSWIKGQLDEYSDVDLIVVTTEKIGGDKEKMLSKAKELGAFLSGFTAEHVGEPRLLVCLYDNPLLHVDIKFLTIEELYPRIENPVILLDKSGKIEEILKQTESEFPYPDYQWIEDRFWLWIHYILLKIGRGEYFETIETFSFLRTVILGPLLHIKNGNLPRGVRNVETQLSKADLIELKKTLAFYDKQSLIRCLDASVNIYKELRKDLYKQDIILNIETEEKVMAFFNEIR